MQMRERRARESSYHPMATDSSDDGAISDGDPPGYAGGPITSYHHYQSPGPSEFPPVSSSNNNSPRPGGGNVHPESLVGVSGGHRHAVGDAFASSSVPSSTASGTKKSGPKRSFDELEDIVFSNPKSFMTLAFAIADSRGVTLIVTDDRTHKTTSAYMHITCAYRKSGCPFILKLTKAKEGGWVLKSSKAYEVDPKQRSIYRCRHVTGSVPEIPTAPPPHLAPSQVAAGSYSHSSSSVPPSNVPVEVAPRSSTTTKDPTPPSSTSTRGVGRPRNPAPSIPAPIYGGGSPARMKPITALPPPGATPAQVLALSQAAAAERALAPPFKRSLVVEHAEPTTTAKAGNKRGRKPRAVAPKTTANGFSAPRTNSEEDEDEDEEDIGAIVAKRARTTSHRDAESTVPMIARSDPNALPDWTRLLTDLSSLTSRSPSVEETSLERERRGGGGRSLVPLARVLASAYMGVTPSEFYDDVVTDEMRLDVLNELPVERVGAWNKVWAKRILVSGEARRCWHEIQAEQGAMTRENDAESGGGGGGGGGGEEEEEEEAVREEETSRRQSFRKRRKSVKLETGFE